MLIESNVLPLH